MAKLHFGTMPKNSSKPIDKCPSLDLDNLSLIRGIIQNLIVLDSTKKPAPKSINIKKSDFRLANLCRKNETSIACYFCDFYSKSALLETQFTIGEQGNEFQSVNSEIFGVTVIPKITVITNTDLFPSSISGCLPKLEVIENENSESVVTLQWNKTPESCLTKNDTTTNNRLWTFPYFDRSKLKLTTLNSLELKNNSSNSNIGQCTLKPIKKCHHGKYKPKNHCKPSTKKFIPKWRKRCQNFSFGIFHFIK